MKRWISVMMTLCILVASFMCGITGLAEENQEVKGTATVNWDYEPVVHKNFTDLGDYVIDLGTISQEDYEKGLAILNSKIDTVSAPACTGIVKRNSKGEVIMGRNMDLEVSNYAAYIAHFVGGKYQAIGFNYNNKGMYTYAQLQQMEEMPDGFREMQAAASLDVFNEAGLYMQTNMRTGDGHASLGTNPGGKRVSMGTLGAIVAQNCGTVAEALEFIRTELDVFSAGATDDGAARSGWDGGIMIGDATGEYGIIEFADNQMYYTPYANGHANAYIHPTLYKYNEYCCGFGRLAFAQQAMVGAETADDMMEAIHKADWAVIVRDIAYSYKDEKGIPHFVDKDGNPSIDYRSELPELFAVDDEGHYVAGSGKWVYTMSQLVASGRLFIGEEPATQNTDGASGSDSQTTVIGVQNSILQIGLETVGRYTKNCNVAWLTDDKNFDEVKQAYMDFFENQNAFELSERFYAGDEQGMRDSGEIFSTGMNFGVNCNEKYLKVRFQEHASCVYEYQW